MKKISSVLMILILVLLCGCSRGKITVTEEEEGTSTPSGVTPESISVRAIGRTLTDGGLWLSWSNSGAEFTFSGTSAYAVMYSDSGSGETQDVLMGVFADDMMSPVSTFAVNGEEKTYTLFEGLENGEHTVRILKLSEALYGSVCVKSVSTDGTAPVPTKSKDRLFEFIGDSVTCGYGTLAPGSRSGFSVLEEDASKTAGYIVSEKVGADMSFICATGFGAAADSSGYSQNTIPNLYEYTAPLFELRNKSKAAKWSFERPADVIFINLGYDEQETLKSDADRQNFINKYAAFVKTVRRYNPAAKIILLCGTVSYDTQDEIKEVYEMLSDDRSVYFYSYSFSCAAVYSGISAGHPSIKSNERMAQELLGFLESLGI